MTNISFNSHSNNYQFYSSEKIEKEKENLSEFFSKTIENVNVDLDSVQEIRLNANEIKLLKNSGEEVNVPIGTHSRESIKKIIGVAHELHFSRTKSNSSIISPVIPVDSQTPSIIKTQTDGTINEMEMLRTQLKIARYGATSYELHFTKGELPKTIINFENSGLPANGNQAFFYNLTVKIGLQMLKKKGSTDIFNLPAFGKNQVEIHLKRKEESQSRRITNFIHAQGEDGILRLEVKVNKMQEIPDFVNVPDGAFVEDDLDKEGIETFNRETRELADTQFHGFKVKAATPSEWDQGIMGKVTPLENETTLPVDSPLVALSTLAFQKYESEFIGSDYFKPEDCLTCIQKRGNEFVLVDRQSPFANDKEQNKAIIREFIDKVVNECGQAKFRYICHQYRLNFEELLEQGQPLTPEHIYRLSIGLNNIEVDDLNRIYTKFPLILDKIEREGEIETPLSLFLSSIDPQIMPRGDQQGLLRAVSRQFATDKPTVADLKTWLEAFKQYPDLYTLPSPLLNQIMEVFALPKDEQEKIYCGREIREYIRGPYITAGNKEFKPWVDQQQLLQIFPLMQSAKNLTQYHEILAHVVCKLHLFHLHPTQGCKVGAILPGPPGENGEKRWYEVREAIYNGYGKVCYDLIPLGNDENLPVIKLYRSTSSDPYAIFGAKTVRSDLNILNPPGYEGMYRTDHYEEPMIDHMTLPLWSAYQMELDRHLSSFNPESEKFDEAMDKASGLIARAKEELLWDAREKHKTLTVQEIVRKHDGILGTLYSLSLIDQNLIFRLRNPNYTKEKDATQKEDARRLIELVSAVRSKNKDNLQLNREIELLIDDLDFYRITDQSEKEQRQILSVLQKEVLNAVDQSSAQLAEALKQKDKKLAYACLQVCSKHLADYANFQGEDISHKKPSNFSFVGHSLGGGYAQVYTTHYLSNRHRVPCPGKHFSMHAFDAPGIREEDNQRFKSYAFENRELFSALDIGIEVYHQHEKSDPATSIHRHLGAAYSIQEAAELMNSVQFTGSLMERLPNAKDPIVAGATTAHETQFLHGKEGIDYKKRVFDPFELGLFEKHEGMTDKLPESVTSKGKRVRNAVWSSPVSPPISTWLQGSKGLYYLANRSFGELWNEHEKEMLPYLDDLGNLAVSSNGLINSKNHFQS